MLRADSAWQVASGFMLREMSVTQPTKREYDSHLK